MMMMMMLVILNVSMIIKIMMMMLVILNMSMIIIIMMMVMMLVILNMVMIIICNHYDDDVGGGHEYDHDRENYGDGTQILQNCILRTS